MFKPLSNSQEKEIRMLVHSSMIRFVRIMRLPSYISGLKIADSGPFVWRYS
jgi:hypothetical protein